MIRPAEARSAASKVLSPEQTRQLMERLAQLRGIADPRARAAAIGTAAGP